MIQWIEERFLLFDHIAHVYIVFFYQNKEHEKLSMNSPHKKEETIAEVFDCGTSVYVKLHCKLL